MNFQHLIGQPKYERELLDLLIFEIEENFEQCLYRNIHFYFDRVADGKIAIVEIVHFQNSDKIFRRSHELGKSREWIGLFENGSHCNLLFCRFDGSGWLSSIFCDHTLIEDWIENWGEDVPVDPSPMTPEEIREAFQSLMGYFSEEIDKQKSKQKRSA